MDGSLDLLNSVTNLDQLDKVLATVDVTEDSLNDNGKEVKEELQNQLECVENSDLCEPFNPEGSACTETKSNSTAAPDSKNFSNRMTVPESSRDNCTESPSEVLPAKQFDITSRTSKYYCSQCSYVTIRADYIMKHKKSHDNGEPIEKCTWCDYKSTPRPLALHRKMCPKNTLLAPLSCPSCSFKTHENFSLIRHKCIHEKNLPIVQCPWCDYKSTRSCVKFHKRECANKKCTSPKEKTHFHKCPHCPATFKNIGNLSRHLKTHETIAAMKCECGFEATPGAVARHRRLKCKLNIKELVRKCPHCPVTVSSASCYLQHLRAHETRGTKICECGFKSTPTYVLRHKRLTCPIKDEDPFKKCLGKCPQCEVTLKTLSSYKRHLRAHEESGTERCECGFESTPSYVHRHKKSACVLKVKEHVRKCPHCPVTLSSRSTYNRHLSAHEINESDFQSSRTKHHKTRALKFKKYLGKCPHCSVTFKTVSSYNQHLKAHKESGTETCECGLESTPSYIQRHKRLTCTSKVKNKVKEYARKCPHCPVSLNSSLSSYYRHLRTHKTNCALKVKEFLGKCPHCAVTFKTPSSYKWHLRAHEESVTEKCECGFESTPAYIQKHKRLTCALLHVGETSHNLHNRVQGKIVQCFWCDYKSTPLFVGLHQKICMLENSHFRCSKCPFSTNLRIKLHKHLESHNYTNIEVLKCGLCPFMCFSKANFEKHASSHQAIESLEPHLSLYKCKFCLFICVDRKIMRRHVASHTVFQCRLCSFSTSLRVKLKIHTKNKHKELVISLERADLDTFRMKPKRKLRVFSCNICTYASPVKHHWTRHLNFHKQSNRPVFQCQYCDFKAMSARMKLHRCPTMRKPRKRPEKVVFYCSKCSFASYIPRHLRRHEKVEHRGAVEQFKCEFCSFTSFWQYVVERHTQSHTLLNLPIAQCATCDFRSTPAVLLAHSNKCLQSSSANKS